MGSLVRRHAVLLFLIVAFAVSWGGWLWALANGGQGGLNPLGPLVAALLIVLLAGGWRGLGAYLVRAGRVTAIGLPVWLVALLLPLAMAFGAAAIAVATGAPWPAARAM